MAVPVEVLTRIFMNLGETDLVTCSLASKMWRACAKQAHIENRRQDVQCKIFKSASVQFRKQRIFKGTLGPVIIYRAHNRVAVRDPVPKVVMLNGVDYPVTCLCDRYIFGAHFIIELTSSARYDAYFYALYLNSSGVKPFILPSFIDTLLLEQTHRQPNWRIEDNEAIYAGLRLFYATGSKLYLRLYFEAMVHFAVERLEAHVQRTKNMLLIFVQMGPDKAEKSARKLQEVTANIANLTSSDTKVREDLSLLAYYGVSSHEFATTNAKDLKSKLNKLAAQKLNLLKCV